MRTYIYIDGFNFYYGAVKDTPYKWLNFKKLFEHLLDSKHEILSIKYCNRSVRPGKVAYSSGCESRSSKAGQPLDRGPWAGGSNSKGQAKVHDEAGRAYFGEMWAFSYLPTIKQSRHDI